MTIIYILLKSIIIIFKLIKMGDEMVAYGYGGVVDTFASRLADYLRPPV